MRVVIQDNALTAYADSHLLGDHLKTVHKALLDVLHVVVAQNEVNLPVQAIEHVVPLLRPAEAEGPEVEDDAVLRDGVVPAANEFFVHLKGVSERPAAETHDVVVKEVGI